MKRELEGRRCRGGEGWGRKSGAEMQREKSHSLVFFLLPSGLTSTQLFSAQPVGTSCMRNYNVPNIIIYKNTHNVPLDTLLH